MNWLIQAIVSILLNLLNERLRNSIKTIDFEEVRKYISLDQLPTYIKGTNRNFKRIPPGVKSGKCLPHLKHIDASEWDNLVQITKQCINEGLAQSGLKSLNQYLRYC